MLVFRNTEGWSSGALGNLYMKVALTYQGERSLSILHKCVSLKSWPLKILCRRGFARFEESFTPNSRPHNIHTHNQYSYWRFEINMHTISYYFLKLSLITQTSKSNIFCMWQLFEQRIIKVEKWREVHLWQLAVCQALCTSSLFDPHNNLQGVGDRTLKGHRV